MNKVMLNAFVDELEKIGGRFYPEAAPDPTTLQRIGHFFGRPLPTAPPPTVLQRAGALLSHGWHGGAPGQEIPGAGWALSNKGWKSRIPLGGKSVTLAMTGMQLPGVLSAQDPTGEGRSRVERGLSLAGQTAGGLMASGAFAKPLSALASKGRLGVAAALAGSMATGLGGSLLGHKILTAPFSHARKSMAKQMMYQQAMQPQAEYYGQGGVT